MSASSDLREKVLAIASTPSRTRREWAVRGAVLAMSAVAVPLLVWWFWTPFLSWFYGSGPDHSVWLGGIRPGGAPDHLHPENVVTRPLPLFLATAFGAAATSAIALWLGFGRGRSTLGRPRQLLLALVIAIPVVLFVWEYAWSASFGPEMLQRWDRIGWRCWWLSLLTGSWPLLTMLLLRRRTDPLHPAITGTVFGVAAGACAWLLVDLWCPVCYVPHLLIGHVFPIALLGAAGAILGQRLLAVRR